MRTIKNSNENTKIVVKDEPGEGGACHEYYMGNVNDPPIVLDGKFGHIHFQNGPVGEKGVNGCYNEDLFVNVIYRLQYFQNGLYACRENALALTKIQEALHWLESRTKDRVERGVEGKNIL